MKTSALKSSSFAFLTACLAVCAASSQVRADGAHKSRHSHTQRCGFTRDLVYLNSVSGPVDVTGTIYTSQNQTYAVLNNTPIAIVIDANSKTVYSPSGSVIGYTVTVTVSHLTTYSQTGAQAFTAAHHLTAVKPPAKIGI